MSNLEEDAAEYEYEYEAMELDVLSQAQADFIYWSNMLFWSLDEGIALLLDKDPEIVNWGVLRHYVNYPSSLKLCLDYSKLRNLVLRALEIQEIDKSNSPTIFLAWAENRGIEIPEDLRQQIAKVATRKTIKPAVEEETENLLKIKEEKITTFSSFQSMLD